MLPPVSARADDTGWLQPPRLAGQAVSVDSVGGVQFVDGVGQVVANGAFGQVQLLADGAGTQALAGQSQNLALPVVQGVLTIPGAQCQFRGNLLVNGGVDRISPRSTLSNLAGLLSRQG